MSTLTTVYSFLKHAQGDTPWTDMNTGFIDLADAELARPRYPFNSPTVGATTTCDLALARFFVFTVSQATTLAFTNVPSSSFWCFVDLLITNGSAFVLTFPGSVTWLQGVAPTFPAAGVDRVRMATKDGGTTWYAVHMGNNLSIARNFKSGYGTAAAQAKPVQILFTGNGGVAGGGAESSLVSFTLPANAFLTTTDQLRIKVTGRAITQNAMVRVKLGGTIYILNSGATNNITAGNSFWSEIIVVKFAGNDERAQAILINGATVVAVERNLATESVTASILIDCRGNAVAGGAVEVQMTVEMLSA